MSMDSPGKNTGLGCYFPLQGIFPTEGSNWCFLHYHWAIWDAKILTVGLNAMIAPRFFICFFFFFYLVFVSFYGIPFHEINGNWAPIICQRWWYLPWLMWQFFSQRVPRLKYIFPQSGNNSTMRQTVHAGKEVKECKGSKSRQIAPELWQDGDDWRKFRGEVSWEYS